ncbi:MAG: hypothetical protein EON87_07880 [Brevundimonas sp.]|nr:MAG: hypothetical protein EON87_07880 [Brevundimonas sp.]
MSDVTVNLLFLALSLVLAALGAAVGGWLQHRSWQHQHWQQMRSERTRAALPVVERAAMLVDKRLFAQRRFLWTLRGGDQTDIAAALTEYRHAVKDWMENLGRTKAELWNAFDKDTAISFEEILHDKFAANGRKLESRYRSGERGGLSAEERELNKLGKRAYEFSQTLLDRISKEEINGLSGHNRLSFQNWENLSSTYLVSRLLGLASDR